MRSFLFFTLLILFSYKSFAQEETVSLDTAQNSKAFILEISPSLQWNTVFDIMTAFGGLEVNSVFKNKIIIGMYGEYFLGDFTKRIVFPNFYSFDQYKVGIVGGLNFRIIDQLSVRPQLKVLYSEAKWTEVEENRFYVSDQFMELRPEIIFAIFPKGRLYITTGIGYHIVNGSELEGTTDEDLTGLNLSLGVKFKIVSH